MERRTAKRIRTDLLINKYIDGYPYACRTVDISKGGVLIERMCEPGHKRTFYPVEIGVPGMPDRIWVWARQVRETGRCQALRFVAMDPFDQVLLDQIISRKKA